ncbi:hypothetical protein [Amycolatopsis sp. DSM 110486]|uniref:hypothetical protein n=1 Tax=Amycolatopsis sp. DSM 110486 TaxID=2865832 RepID=UPI001C6A15FF|nr:hypothetical protein [Amycolatopsis sp. DSM 110486]QYN26685.1 hypothetical protein K1T34_52885 [Amycolatopsis sp. DSM 110486]
MQIQHYRIASPLDTHFRVGTCEEDRCSAYLNGWRTVVDETTQLGQQQAAYIRADRTRRHVESSELVDGAARTVFTFEAGQRCFRTHRVPLDRPELYLVEGTGFRRVHSGPDPWVDDLNTNQARLSALINRG